MANRKVNGTVITPHLNPWFFGCNFLVTAGSAVSTQSTGSAAYVTWSKPAGTGIYRATFTDPFIAVLYCDAFPLKAAGTFDGDIFPVAMTNENTATPLVVDFQTRKTSDGTAFDPVSITIYASFWLRNSQVTP